MNKIKLKVKKGDKVLVISGKDKGKSGEIEPGCGPKLSKCYENNQK